MKKIMDVITITITKLFMWVLFLFGFGTLCTRLTWWAVLFFIVGAALIVSDNLRRNENSFSQGMIFDQLLNNLNDQCIEHSGEETFTIEIDQKYEHVLNRIKNNVIFIEDIEYEVSNIIKTNENIQLTFNKKNI